LVEITFADDPLKFDCQNCPEAIRKLRRCNEDKFDFTYKDNVSIFPIYALKEGTPYGFCPGKASWFPHIHGLFKMLVLVSETGQPPYDGGWMGQPDRLVAMLGWFVPMYDQMKFIQRAKMILGDGSKTKGASHGNNNRRTDRKSHGR